MGTPDKKYTASPGELKSHHPVAGRPTMDIFYNLHGEIIALDTANFGIQCKDINHTLLLPLNLPAVLQKAGVTVMFSGEVKQANPTELWAAQPFILTDIKEI